MRCRTTLFYRVRETKSWYQKIETLSNNCDRQSDERVCDDTFKWLNLVCRSYLVLPSFPLIARPELKTNTSCKTTAKIIRTLGECVKSQAVPLIWMNLGGRTMLVHTYIEYILIPQGNCLQAPLNMRFLLKMKRSSLLEMHWVKRGQFVLKWVQFQSEARHESGWMCVLDVETPFATAAQNTSDCAENRRSRELWQRRQYQGEHHLY